MSRLIDADALEVVTAKVPKDMDAKSYMAGMEYVLSQIDALPTIEERKTGKWQITDAYPHNIYCSECHRKFAQTHWAVWEDGSLPRNFCPNCGADMREQP